MKQLFRKFLGSEEGQDLVEYAFLVAFIALVVVIAVTNLGINLNTFYQGIADNPNLAT